MLVAFLAIAGGAFPVIACPPEGTVKVVTGDKTIIGRPLAMTSDEIVLMRRDGRIVELARTELKSVKAVSTIFTPYTSLKLQEHFQGLFGKRYEVSRTAHFVVVHPRGLRQQWAEPFEALYGRFTHYFSARGYTLATPEFPMIVVVLESRSEFVRIANRDGLSNPQSYAGYYSQTSNWIVTNVDSDFGEGNSTLTHEALHQFAFNRGIHQRWSDTPKWCAEGLATMFEAAGVNNSLVKTSARDRQHPYYLDYLKRRLRKQGPGELFENLVGSDDLFDRDVELGYALSWGLVWYLAETRHAQFNSYLQKIARRPPMHFYSADDRIADFREAFGIDFVMLESHFLKYVSEAR